MAGYIGSKASVVSSGAERKKVFNITGATTSLTGCNYTVGKVQVFQNGVRLLDGTDYTATDGTTVTLTVAAQSGDNVVVLSQASFQVADAVLTSGDTMTGNLSFGDNDKAIFGAGSDLQIYHDGTHSYVDDSSGTGRLILKTDYLEVQNAAGNEAILGGIQDGAVSLFYNGNTKLATTSTGVDVTGSVTADGLTVTQTGSTTATIGATGTSGDNDGTLIINNGGSGDGMLRFDYETNTDRARIGVSASSQNLQFYTAGNNERMRIDSSGSLLVGHTSKVSFPSQTILFQAGGGGTTFVIERNDSLDVIQATTFANTSNNRTHYAFRNSNGEVGNIQTSGSSTSYNTSSDYRLKENVVDLTGASARVNQLDVKRFNFIADDTNTLVDGFLAHEVATVVPEAVTGTHDAMKDEEYEVTPAVLDDDGNVTTEAVMGTRSVPDYQGIDQSKLVPLLTAALQEALTEIASLKTRVEALEA